MSGMFVKLSDGSSLDLDTSEMGVTEDGGFMVLFCDETGDTYYLPPSSVVYMKVSKPEEVPYEDVPEDCPKKKFRH